MSTRRIFLLDITKARTAFLSTMIASTILLLFSSTSIAGEKENGPEDNDKPKSAVVKNTSNKNSRKSEIASGEAVRLPRNVSPDKYRIFIEPDLENKQFSGEETIFLTVTTSTKDIVLNSVALEIAETEITASSDADHGKSMAAERVIEDKEKQQVALRFAESLKPGKYELRLKFGGRLNKKLEGFYISTFNDEKGQQQRIACTQLEATDARKVFPCFDEPDMKATFKITLAIDPALTAISNAPIEFDKVEGRGNKRRVTFVETPKMSTYLVALIVGPFESTDPVNANGVEIRVWATPGHKEEGTFARGAAEKMLPYFESYFGVPYPLRKLDMIAIPDFAAGAMENLGAITFRESRLLVDDKTASTTTKQDVASIIAHEMAHMWFGDVVTMKWWDDLWLNEAFATWMSVKAMNSFKPEWHPWDLFVRDRDAALASDALVSSTRPIYTPVKNPTDAEEMFDEITYEKGASVLRMLERYLGEETYMRGIQKYIRDNQFGNAQTSQLWDALGAMSGKPVADIMQEWVYSPGYPLVKIETRTSKSKSDSGTGASINLTQDYFSVSPNLEGKKEQKSALAKARKLQLWQIPMTSRILNDDPAKISESELIRYLFDGKKTAIQHLPSKEPFIANAGADGYYRVQYPQDMLEHLGKKAQISMTPRERYQILNDCFALVEAGLMPLSQYMDFTASYRDESDPTVVELLISQIDTLDLFVGQASRASFAFFVKDRFGTLSRKLGWEAQEDESDLTQLLRSHVLTAMGTVGQDSATIAEARKYWNIYQEKPEEINPNLYESIVAIMAYNGDDNTYEEMKRLYDRATTPEAKLRNLYGLAYFRKPELQKRTLELAVSDKVKTQDAPHVVLKLLKTTAGREVGWSFVKQHWKDMETMYPVHLFPRIVTGATSFVSSEQSKDLEQFLSTHPIKAGNRVSGKVIERVRSNVKLNERSSASLDSWLKDFQTRTSAASR
ncbi:MAG: ERAP1-like C-terminal domain-containing protein [Candidatus Obscuribacterales bacterium]|nr:ERAP1-like C-terminal domain-containing protein [Candidatus Obscuribacterales bacterium]